MAALAESRVDEAVRLDLCDEHDAVAALMERVRQAIEAPVSASRQASRISVAFAAGLCARGQGAVDQHERWIALRRTEDVLAVLAHRATLPIHVLVAAYDAENRSALIVIARGLDCSWSFTKSLILTRAKSELSWSMLQASHDAFQLLSPLGARRMVRAIMVPRRRSGLADRPGRGWGELALTGCQVVRLGWAGLECRRCAEQGLIANEAGNHLS